MPLYGTSLPSGGKGWPSNGTAYPYMIHLSIYLEVINFQMAIAGTVMPQLAVVNPPLIGTDLRIEHTELIIHMNKQHYSLFQLHMNIRGEFFPTDNRKLSLPSKRQNLWLWV